MPDTLLSYTQFEDLSGVTFDGAQTTVVNLMGNGGMVGIVDFVVRDGPAPTDIAIEGSLDYDPVTIGNGVAAGGHYVLDVTSPTTGSFDISYTFATTMDLRATLPVE